MSNVVAGDAPGRVPARDRLRALLAAEDTSFGFFRAVELLEQLHPERAPVGGFGDPADEVARFGAKPSLAFPAAELRVVDLPADAPAALEVTFLGLTGPSGVLPNYYTEQVMARVAARDTTLRDFLDLFHHRLVSLFYRAWRKTRPQGTGAGALAGGSAWLTAHLRDLVGLGTPGLQDRLPVPDEALLYYAGLLVPQPRSASALRQLLSEYFGVHTEVEQFVGGWYALAPGTQCALGEDDASTRLGDGAVAGDEVYDQQGRVRVRLGPLTRAQYASFLPTGGARAALGALVRLFAGDALDVELQLVLARDEVPALVLGDPDAPPLGWCTWLRARPMARDPDDAVLAL
ncbi:hypothetical protein tb265_17640 [Gemmatimonadetes bacterium T265]|nr:hypothetical protein tb265_17640 [Gemmatimonadetes bacterium T265]